MRLTDKKIKAIQPTAKAYKLSDVKGLYLLVQPNGGTYWRFNYRSMGKQKQLALGVYPEVSLADARQKLLEACKLLSNGIDPGEAKQQEKRQHLLKTANSFEMIAKEWYENQKLGWTLRRAHYS